MDSIELGERNRQYQAETLAYHHSLQMMRPMFSTWENTSTVQDDSLQSLTPDESLPRHHRPRGLYTYCWMWHLP
jgi:hypothetical protein